MTRIIIIDDDKIVRDALSTLLNAKGYEVVACGENADEAETLYFKHKPQVVLMDIRMGEKSGLDATRKILEKDPSANILLVTTFHDKDYIDEAIRLGCKGYILKENISGIDSAISSILNDKIVYDSKIIESLIDKNNDKKSDKTPYKNEQKISELSERENEILALVADGLNNKEIATKLYLSEGTVRNYISNILQKLDLRDRTQMAVYYYKH